MNFSTNSKEWVNILKQAWETQQKAGHKTHKAIQKIKEDCFSQFLKLGLPSAQAEKSTNINRLWKTLPFVCDTSTGSAQTSVASSPRSSTHSSTKGESAGLASSFGSTSKGEDPSLFSIPATYNLHFHNGVLTSNSILPKEIQFCEWNNLQPDFPSWDWIVQKKSNEVHQRDGFYYLSGALPVNGYVLFISSALGKQSPIDLHIHFSFDESFSKTCDKTMLGKQNIFKKHSSSFNKTGITKESLGRESIKGQNDEKGSEDSLGVSPLWNFKNFIFLDKGANLVLTESVSLQGRGVVNMGTEVRQSVDSSFKWVCPSFCEGVYFNQVYCDMEKGSFLDRLAFSAGAPLFSKDVVSVSHLEERAYSSLLGLAILRNKGLREEKYYIHHAKEEGYGKQLVRGVLHDQAQHVFRGKIHVASEAVQTDCSQSAKNLLLSPLAKAHTQPELEIQCGEVKARHGATTGQFNQDEIFYLQSRGVEQKVAFELLMMGYVKEVLDQFPEKPLSEHLIRSADKL